MNSINEIESGQILKQFPRMIPGASMASVEFTTAHPIYLEKYSRCCSWGRMAIRAAGVTLGFAKVTEINYS